MIQLTLQGAVPSKKNAWRRPTGRGKAYLPPQIQADIDALVIQAQASKHKYDLKPIHEAKRLRVVAEFHVKKETVDLDNAWTTLLDVLQKAGVILNDKRVRSGAYDDLVNPDVEEHVCINIMAI